MQTTTLASAECFVSWRSNGTTHRDWRYFPKLNFWRDFLPGDLGESMRMRDGRLAEVDVYSDEALPVSGSTERIDLPQAALEQAFHRRHLHGPFTGRFYPRSVLAQVNGAGTMFPQDFHPFRVLRLDGERVEVDLGHPLGGYPLTVGGRISGLLRGKEERGGSCNDLLADLTEGGPGMQCPPEGGRVDFEQVDNFSRQDPATDELFYARPRMVHHIDSQARKFINAVYRRSIEPGDRVLDLMSSWVSHLDGSAALARITGLGMNRKELQANPLLDDFVIHDLNHQPWLPWNDADFDVAICTASVEYLVQPYAVFAEVARVLRPGGRFIITFSDRWFPPKVIRLWIMLHPFERLGLVLDYFRRSGAFTGLGTESWVGWPRPADDKYYGKRPDSDPVFAVWGTRA
jgi:hypothetical protein